MKLVHFVQQYAYVYYDISIVYNMPIVIHISTTYIISKFQHIFTHICEAFNFNCKH